MTQTEVVIGLLERKKEAGITQADAKKALKKVGLDSPGFKLSTTITAIRFRLGGYESVIRFTYPGLRGDRWGLRKYVENEIPQSWWKQHASTGKPKLKKSSVVAVSEHSIATWVDARRTVKEAARACKVVAPMMLWPEALEHERNSILKLMEDLIIWADEVMAFGEQRKDEDYLRAKIDKIRQKHKIGVGNSDNERAEAEKKVAIFERRLLEVRARSLNGHG